jgi:hypothetical protein
MTRFLQSPLVCHPHRKFLKGFTLSALAVIGQASGQTHVWEDKSNGQLILTCGTNLYYAPNNHKWNQDQRIGNQPITCGGAPGFEWEPSNWSVPGYPNSPTASVLISSIPPVELNIGVEIGSLQITAGNELQMFTGSVLNVHNSISNDGLIRLNDLTGGDTILRINGNVDLTGNGQILFDSLDDNTIDSADSSYVLTIGSNQTLLADSDTLINQSHINTRFVNNGTITADEGWLQVKNHPATNNNLIRAANGGTLRLLGTILENQAGTLTADAESTVTLGGTTIIGGTLNGTGAFELETSDAIFDGTTSPVTNDGTINIDSYDKLTIKGTFNNNGAIVLNDASGDVAAFEISGDVILNGSGLLRFKSNDDNWITAVNPTDVLTIGPDQELITSAAAVAGYSASRITASIVNDGIITADQGGLQIDSHPKINNSLIQSVNGGLIRFSDVTITNDEGGGDPTIGTITAGAGSTVRFNATTIVGGTLNGAGNYTLEGRDTVFDGTIVPPVFDSSITLDGNNSLTLRGTVLNEGTIHLDDRGWASPLVIDGDVTLNGSGRVRFESNDDNVIESGNPIDILTIGANQTLTTSDVTLNGQSIIYTALNNQVVVEARVGGLTLSTNPKTNNGVFRAVNGGTFQILAPDSILTNYKPLTGTLSGGRWEVISNDMDTTMSLAGDPRIEEIGTGTTVLLSGSQSMFPGIESLATLNGTLPLHNKQVFTANGNLDVNGHLEFGLTNGAIDGWNATMLHVTDIDLSGATIDIVDLGLKPSTYRVIQYEGTRSGTPVLGRVPAGFNFALDTSNPGFVNLLVNTGPTQSDGQITSSNILNSIAGEAYEHQIQADNNPTEFTATGLPSGLTLDPATGIISGTPLVSGLFTVEITAIGPDRTVRQNLTLVSHSPEETVFDNNNIGGVSSGPSNPTTFTLADPTRITYVMDYHYFNGGVLPGTIALQHSDGTTYGPWPAEGRVGQGGVLNAYWKVWPMEVLKAGTYTIVDSHPATWSHNSTSGNRGMSMVKGETSPTTDAQVLALWAANNGLEGADADPEADPDGDKTANWIEIAMGSNPARMDPVAYPQLIATAGSTPSVSFTAGAGGTGVSGGNFVINGARITLKITSNMADWNPSTELLDLAKIQRQPLAGGRETLTLPLKPDVLPLGSWFIRSELSRIQTP